MRKPKVTTRWEVRTYDVWGNAKDGYDVNQSFRSGEVELDLEVKTFNPGTPQQFESAYPSDKQLRQVFGLTNIRLETDGDDLAIYVERARDGYPIGELYCLSHDSLSPIRAKV